MENNQPNPGEAQDKSFEDLKSKLPMEDADDAPKPPVKPAEVPPVVETPKEKKEEEDDEEDDDDAPPPAQEKKPKASRPERYIPIDQYTDEKDKWNSTIKEQADKITELEKIANLNQDSKKFEDAVKKYAEKHNCDEDIARAEIEKVRDIIDFTSPTEKKAEEKNEEKPARTPEEEQLILDGQLAKAEKQYNEEFTTLAVPEIKDLFPTVTSEQLEVMREELMRLATIKKYLDKDLDYIVFKEQEALGEILNAKAERKGPEATRPPQKGKQTYTVQDFESGKTPFSELESLSTEERDKIVKAMSTKTWDRYIHHIGQNEELSVSE